MLSVQLELVWQVVPSSSAAPTAPDLQAKQQDSQYNVVIDKEDVLAKVGGAGMTGRLLHSWASAPMQEL